MKFQPRNPKDDALVDRLVREILALPEPERMTAFAEKMLALKEALIAAHPKASRRDLASRGQALGLLMLDKVTAAAHRAQFRELQRKGQR